MRAYRGDVKIATNSEKREQAERAEEQAITRLETAAANLRATRSRIQRILGPAVNLPPGLETLASEVPNEKDTI
jgi:hypothetical protein